MPGLGLMFQVALFEVIENTPSQNRILIVVLRDGLLFKPSLFM